MKNLILITFILIAFACDKTNKTAKPQIANHKNITSIFYKDVDLSKLLKARNITEFTDTNKEAGQDASIKKIYQDNLNADNKYVFSDSMKSEGFLEAYAGTLYHFLLGKHSSFTQFVFDNSAGKNNIIGASLYSPTYKDSYSYHVWNRKPLLPPGSGLGAIIAASMLLKEVDLKGLASANSNLGIVTENGLSYYFKIDHADSFHFNNVAGEKDFNLADLKNPKSDMKYIKRLYFKSYPATDTKVAIDHTLSQNYLDEIANAAKYLANIPQDKLIEVLDFCEAQLQKLDTYPDDRIKGTSYKTYKEAILDRFKTLRAYF